MIGFKKIRAGSLQFVLFIGAVIAVLLLTFVLLSHSHLFFSRKAEKFVEVIKQNDVALKLSLLSDGSIPARLQDNNRDNITSQIDRNSWGLYERYQVTTSFEKNSFKKVSLVGSTTIQPDTPALYLKDNQRPLIVVGSTKIRGKTYLPQQGIRPGNISGTSYFGNTLVHGKIEYSAPTLSRIDQKLRERVDLLCHQTIASNYEIIQLPKDRNLKNSFFNKPLVLSGSTIDLTNTSLIGNIVVRASNEILVNATSRLTDVVLSAPNITIGDGTIGTFQAFASKQIKVGKNCSLNYPSALIVSNKNPLPQKRTSSQHQIIVPIQINSGSVIKGDVVYLHTSKDRVFEPQVKLEPNATLVGQLYCEKSLELKGAVEGSVFTDSFISVENGSIYQNHLFNGVIDQPKVYEGYTGIDLSESNGPKKVMKWLY